MGKIKQLPLEEIKKIAAGEVVERPTNIIKELIENSIDACANQITLYIEDGGKKLIKLIDNGSGMSMEDAQACIKHHATSKITKVEDLQNITTFGFRGEALSSIASVSDISLTTKLTDEEAAKILLIHQGKITKKSLASGNNGTTITITNLFDNVPARKKFLKSTQTEYRAISQLFYAYCLSNWNIAFKFFSESKLIFNCPQVSNLEKRLEQLFDSYLFENLLIIPNFNDEKNKFTINGALTKPNYNRFDRNQIFIFVNRRLVKNYKLSQALIKGYQNILPTGKFPAGFIFITISPDLLDVNIHPRKEEVQFIHPGIIERELTNLVTKTLEKYHSEKINPVKFSNLTFESEIGKKEKINDSKIEQLIKIPNAKNTDDIEKFEPALISTNSNVIVETENCSNTNNTNQDLFFEVIDKCFSDKIENNLQSLSENFDKESTIAKSNLFLINNFESNYQKNALDLKQNPAEIFQEKFIQTKINVNQHEESSKLPALNFDYKIIGQSFLTYIIIETENGIVFIDQHAAHERIIYEELKQNSGKLARTLPLFNQTITLTKDYLNIILEHQDKLNHYGFKVEQIGQNSIRALEVPLSLKQEDLEDILKFIANWFLDNKQEEGNLENILGEKIYAKIACTTAVKAGDKLNSTSMGSIVNKLYSVENKLTCPHGRPTIWPLEKSTLEKQFKRNYK